MTTRSQSELWFNGLSVRGSTVRWLSPGSVLPAPSPTTHAAPSLFDTEGPHAPLEQSVLSWQVEWMRSHFKHSAEREGEGECQ